MVQAWEGHCKPLQCSPSSTPTGEHWEGWDCWGREEVMSSGGHRVGCSREGTVLACEVCAFPQVGEVFPLLKQKISLRSS